MYKIYINGTPLLLVNTASLGDNFTQNEHSLVGRYTGKAKSLFNYIDLLEKSHQYQQIIVHYKDEKKLFKDFKALYKIMRAAGGLVTNDQGEILVIFRRDFWDLPKGKIEKDEKKKQAAIREVEEETGLGQITLGKKIGITYHTYRDRKGRRVLKKSFWYHMQAPRQDLTPQTEEDIEQAIWVDPVEFLAKDRVIYGNILDVLNAGLGIN